MSSLAEKHRSVTQNQPPPTSVQPQGNMWRVAPDQPPAIAGLLAPVLSETQICAIEQHRLGLNIIKLPPYKKAGYPTKIQQTTRLPFDENDRYNPDYLVGVLADECNIGVMCGHTSGKDGTSLTVIDCDSVENAALVMRELTRLGIPIYGVKTYRGAHYYIRTRRELKNTSLNGIDIIASKKHVVTYPSVVIVDEKTRETYTYQRFGDATEPPYIDNPDPHAGYISDVGEIAFDFDDGASLNLEYSRPGHRGQQRGLNRLTDNYLNSGAQMHDGRKLAFFQAACDMWGNRWTPAQIQAKLIPIVEVSGFSGMDADQAIKKAHESIKSACSKPRNVAQTHYAQWQHVLAYIADNPFKGDQRRRNRLTAVIPALIGRAAVDTNEKGIFRATEREISVLSRIDNRTTIRRAINELVVLGIIERVDPSTTKKKYREQNSFRWCNFPALYPLGQSPKTSSCSGYQTGIFNLDAIEAIRFTAGKVYEALCSRATPLRAAAIAELANLNDTNAVYRALSKDSLLITQGLVQRVKGGWTAQRTTPQRLNELLAVPAGTMGKGKARKERHALERARNAARDIIKYVLEHTDQREAYKKRLKEFTRYHAAINPEYYNRTPRKVKPAPDLLKCPNCGQLIAAAFGAPDMCDYCKDLTTWKPTEPPASNGNREMAIQTLFGNKLAQLPLEAAVQLLPEVQVVEVSEISDKPTSKREARRLIDATYESAKNPIMAALRKKTIDQDQASALIKQLEAQRTRQRTALAEMYQ